MTSLINAPESIVPDLTPSRRITPPLLMSLVLHVISLTLIGLYCSKMPSGTGATDDRKVGIALVHRLPDRDRYVDSVDVATSDIESDPEQSNPVSASSNPPADMVPPLDLAGVLRSIEAIPAPESGSGLAGETDLGEDAFGDGKSAGPPSDASKTTATLFGVSGTGSRFVYVFDRSDSMNGYGGTPLRQAKRELIRSLNTLSERQQFQIIFYNDKPTPFRLGGLPLQMIRAEPGYLNQAESYVRSIAAFGGTSHEDALKMAIRMGPDVIFFLTDARIPRLSSKQLREIRTRAENAGTTIHAIEFGGVAAVPANSFLRELAEMNRGEYRYVDVRRMQSKASGR